MEIKIGAVPRPDGHLPEELLTNGSGDDLAACTERITEHIEMLETEIERRQHKCEELSSALAIIKEFRSSASTVSERD
jgi:archaellum component FlaC